MQRSFFNGSTRAGSRKSQRGASKSSVRSLSQKPCDISRTSPATRLKSSLGCHGNMLMKLFLSLSVVVVAMVSLTEHHLQLHPGWITFSPDVTIRAIISLVVLPIFYDCLIKHFRIYGLQHVLQCKTALAHSSIEEKDYILFKVFKYSNFSFFFKFKYTF